MTWVTVQTNDIGDTFLGIYALERVFGVGGAEAVCPRLQGKKGVLHVVVSSFWGQSQERLQVVEALSGGGSAGFEGCFASAPLLCKSASLFLARSFASSTRSASALGPKEAASGAAKNISWNEARSGSEHSGTMAGAKHSTAKRKRHRSPGPVCRGAGGERAALHGCGGFQNGIRRDGRRASRSRARCVQRLC